MIQKIREEFRQGIINKPQFIDAMYIQHQSLFEYAALLQTVDIASIEIRNDGVLFSTRNDGIKFFCKVADKRTAPFEILNFREYESADAGLLYKLINNGDTIFDIGANIGWYSMVLSKKFPLSFIHSFEPLPDTYASLVENISLNDGGKIIVNNFGFSNENKILKFYALPYTSVSNSSQNISDDAGAIEIACKVVTLDSYVFEKSIKIDIIKCDVEGAELLVYQGGIQTIERDQPIIFTEMLRKWSAKFGYHPNDIIAFFTMQGYQCFINNGNHQLSIIKEVIESTINTNFFFLHPEKHAAILSRYVDSKL
ncbi:MAG: FkbM family methyltransferase [Ferruginibacter sp.]